MIWAACLLGVSMCGPPSLRAEWLGVNVVQATIQSVVQPHLLPVGPEMPEFPVSPPAPYREEPNLGDATLCTLNVVNEDPAKILQVLSAQSKTNLVLLSGSDKKLTLNLKAVPLQEMIRHICALTGLTSLKVGETYVLATAELLKTAYPTDWEAAHPTVAPPPAVPKPVLVTASILLNHVSATKMAPVLEKFFDKQTLTIAAGPTQESPKVSNQNTSQATGSSTSVLPGTEGSSADLTAKTLIFRGPEEMVREAEALAKRLDVPRAQVVIQVEIYDILDSALKEIGSTWNFGSTTVTEGAVDRINFGTFQRTGFNFQAAIKAMERKDAAKVLASPNISVLDGERAFILIGDRINYPVLVGFSNANTPIFSKEEERVGIYLQVAASVASDGQITLSLYPQVSTITGFLEVNGASYPQISTREAQSTLRVKSGDTLLMGGLMKTEEVKQMERVPLLGQIPFLGELFTRRKSTQTASQVVIVIKPMLLKSDESR